MTEELELKWFFDDQSPSSANGFEAGLLWCLLAGPVEHGERFEKRLRLDNEGTIRRIARRWGWAVEFAPTEEPGWVDVYFERRLQLVVPT